MKEPEFYKDKDGKIHFLFISENRVTICGKLADKWVEVFRNGNLYSVPSGLIEGEARVTCPDCIRAGLACARYFSLASPHKFDIKEFEGSGLIDKFGRWYRCFQNDFEKLEGLQPDDGPFVRCVFSRAGKGDATCNQQITITQYQTLQIWCYFTATDFYKTTIGINLE